MHSSKHRVLRLDNLAPPSATQLDIDELQSQAEHASPSTLLDNEPHHTPRTPRSPCATRESVPVAEYQEWPFQGFLKRTRIGNEINYNLDFKLPCVSKRFNFPVPGEALDTGSSIEASAKPILPCEAISHSKIHKVGSQRQKKRAPWTEEEDAMVIRMREDDGWSWDEIHDASPSGLEGRFKYGIPRNSRHSIDGTDSGRPKLPLNT